MRYDAEEGIISLKSCILEHWIYGYLLRSSISVGILPYKEISCLVIDVLALTRWEPPV